MPSHTGQLTREMLEADVTAKLSQREIASRRGVSQTTVRYWIQQFGLSTDYITRRDLPPGQCRTCGRQLKGRRRHRCGPCNTRIRRHRVKERLIEMMGGKCADCDWSGRPIAFDFHHPNPDKEFNIGQTANKSWAVVLREALKCVLLCSRCHRLRHDEPPTEAWRDEMTGYQGTLLLGSSVVAAPV